MVVLDVTCFFFSFFFALGGGRTQTTPILLGFKINLCLGHVKKKRNRQIKPVAKCTFSILFYQVCTLKKSRQTLETPDFYLNLGSSRLRFKRWLMRTTSTSPYRCFIQSSSSVVSIYGRGGGGHRFPLDLHGPGFKEHNDFKVWLHFTAFLK